jgi:hypothetical protein
MLNGQMFAVENVLNNRQQRGPWKGGSGGMDREVTIFTRFVERGLTFLAGRFFQGLLCHYGFEVHHLNPNTIFHLFVFVVLCELWLAIEPNLDLFRWFFHPFSNGWADPVGCVRFSLREGKRARQYIHVPLTSNVPNWHRGWFYVDNSNWPSLPIVTGQRAKPVQSWEYDLEARHRPHIQLALDPIRVLRDQGLHGRLIGWQFLHWRVQPLALRSRLLYEYQGLNGPDRMVLEVLSQEEPSKRLSPLAGQAPPGELDLFATTPAPYWAGRPLVSTW